MDLNALAETGYAAYGASVGWKNFRGDPMPSWAELPVPQRDAWLAATAAIRAKLEG